MTLDGRVIAVGYMAQGDSLAAGKPRMWTEARLQNFDIAPDGRRLTAFVADDGEAGKLPTSLTFLLNVGDELRRKAAEKQPQVVRANLYIQMVLFKWDEQKNRGNVEKHRVDFETAQLIFDDPFRVTFTERTEGGEERWHGIGTVAGLVLLLVVPTYRESEADQIIRIISARQATRHERNLYEAAHSSEAH